MKKLLKLWASKNTLLAIIALIIIYHVLFMYFFDHVLEVIDGNIIYEIVLALPYLILLLLFSARTSYNYKEEVFVIRKSNTHIELKNMSEYILLIIMLIVAATGADFDWFNIAYLIAIPIGLVSGVLLRNYLDKKELRNVES